MLQETGHSRLRKGWRIEVDYADILLHNNKKGRDISPAPLSFFIRQMTLLGFSRNNVIWR